jgi:conjugal transfer pilus assembly protein TraV
MNRKIFLGAAAAVLLLSGCSGLGLGGGSYSCQGYPETVQCKSAREVYELTNYRDSLEKQKGEADCPECGDHPGNPGASGNPGLTVTPAQYASMEAVQGLGYRGPLPLRSAAQIMRVWVAPWESLDGALHLPTYLYAEVVERRWSIGEKRLEVAPQITPLLDRSLPEAPGREQKQAKPPAKGKKAKDLSDLGPPRINPRPAPELDASIKKSKNTPKNAFFDRQTGKVKPDTFMEQ